MSNFPDNPSVDPPPGATWGQRVRRNPVFRFFSSLRLALLLLAVLIAADAAGTIYESKFSSEVARAYIYEAWWFNLWLLMLCVNLASVAFSRRPWRPHHTGFLLTHFGIITLLVGAVVGRLGGIEGTITLFKGNPPTSFLVTDQRFLRVTPKGRPSNSFRVTILPSSPSPNRPVRLGTLKDGTEVWATDYAKKLDAVFTPIAEPSGQPAVKLRLSNAMMNQTIEQWIILDSEDHQTLDLGLIKIQFKRGQPPVAPRAPSPNAGALQPLEENIFSFAHDSDQQINKIVQGGSTGTKVTLSLDGDQPLITILRGPRQWTLAAKPGLTQALDDRFTVQVDHYWPDFRITDSGPVSVSDQPNNPAVSVTIRGMGLPTPGADAEEANDPHADESTDPMSVQHSGEIDLSATQQLSFHLDPDPGKAPVDGPVTLNQPIPTGWGAWTLTVTDFLPSAQENTFFRPTPKGVPPMAGASAVEGLKVKLVQGDNSDEEWVAMGWSVDYPLNTTPVVVFAYRTIPLPFGLQLTNFDVEREEGSDSPAGFKSTLLVTDTDGKTYSGACSMNTPMNYPSAFWRSLTGFTYKISQASWDPDNLDQSSVQILFDPGWSLKWFGSLVICSGIFCLFYLRPPRRGPLPSPAPTKPLLKKSNLRETSLHV